MKSYDFKKLPITSGIYQFLDETGKVLYVGKAKNLKNRIKSYFAKEIGRGPAIDTMVDLAIEIKTIQTDSEIEAILLEAEVIKKLKPKYNVRLRDDKSFLVIKITKPKKPAASSQLLQQTANSKQQTANETLFPCVELVRFKNVNFQDKSARYFGPYPAGLLLKKSLFYLRKIFPFRDCSKTKYATYRKKGRPCIYGDIRVCTAPCVAWVNEKEYKKNINYLIDFLKGKKEVVIKNLKKEMTLLSKSKRFEEASLMRDKLYALDHLKEVAIGLRDDYFNGDNTLFSRIECYDISNIGENYVVGSMIVFKDGKKSTDDYRKFKIKFTKEESDLARLKEMLERRFKNDWTLPNLILIDGGEAQLRVATEILRQSSLKIPAVSISKGKKRDKNEFHFADESIAKYIKNNLPLQNVLIQARDEAHRFAISYYRSLHKKGLFE